MADPKKKTSILTWLLAAILCPVIAISVFQSATDESDSAYTPRESALNMARHFVRQNLKDKTGAEFDRSSEGHSIRRDGLHAASGSVRSMNGFGAKLDNDWSVIMRDNADGTWSLVWLRVGGQKTGEYPADE